MSISKDSLEIKCAIALLNLDQNSMQFGQTTKLLAPFAETVYGKETMTAEKDRETRCDYLNSFLNMYGIDSDCSAMKVFCHQPGFKEGCSAYGKQIQNIGWASKTGERNAYRCRVCGVQWSQINIKRLRPKQNPQVKYDTKRGIAGSLRANGYRHNKRIGGCGLYKRADLARLAGEAVCTCRSQN